VEYERAEGRQGRLGEREWRRRTLHLLRRADGVKVVSKRVYRREGNGSSKEKTATVKERRRKVRGGEQVEIRLGIMTMTKGWSNPLILFKKFRSLGYTFASYSYFTLE
jgi:hypothetical protein